MPFNGKSGKFNASINAVEVGCGEKAIKIAARMYYLSIHLMHRLRTHRKLVL